MKDDTVTSCLGLLFGFLVAVVVGLYLQFGIGLFLLFFILQL